MSVSSSAHIPPPDPFRLSRCLASGRSQNDLREWHSTRGGLFALRGLRYDPDRIRRTASGVARYADLYPLPPDADTLDTGNTPLVEATLFGRKLRLKEDHKNPTGSFKDRGMAVIANLVRDTSAPVVVDSVGNTAAAMAAFARALDLDAHVFVPLSASEGRIELLRTYGAAVHRVAGPRVECGKVARAAAEDGAIYLSHIYHPLFQAGTATCAFEVFEQLGRAPARVTCAVGQGTLFLGLWHGFRALRYAGLTDSVPRLIAVRPENPPHTVAVGAAATHPVRARETGQAAYASKGAILTVPESEIEVAHHEFTAAGYVVDPAASLALAGWRTLAPLPEGADDVVVICGTEREPFSPFVASS